MTSTTQRAAAGHQVRVGYGWEDEFATLPAGTENGDWSTTDLNPFGINAQVDSAEGSNALQRVFQPSERIGIDILEMIFDGSFSISFTLTNPWWLRGVTGSPTETDETTHTSYTYNVDLPSTFNVVEAYEPADAQRVLLGCMITQVTIDVSIEEEVTVSLEGAYADEKLQKASDLTEFSMIDQPPIEGEPMTFVEGSIDVAGERESFVQSMSLNLTSTIDPVREMGSRVSVAYLPKVIEPDVDFTKIFDADDDMAPLETMYGGSGATSPQESMDDDAVITLDFDNGETGEDIEHGTFTVTGSLPESLDESGIGDPNAELEQTINRMGLDFTGTWETANTEPAV